MSQYFNPSTDPKLFGCPCCGKGGPTPMLLLLLDAMRGIYSKPMIVTSGPRCPEYNKQVGGVPDSAHLTGQAADIACSNSRDRYAMIQAAIECGAKRIGVDKVFIHVDVDPDLPEGMWLY